MNTNLQIKAGDLMTQYLMLPASEREGFDRMYGERTLLLKLHEWMAKAKPEQLQRVREILARGRKKG